MDTASPDEKASLLIHTVTGLPFEIHAGAASSREIKWFDNRISRLEAAPTIEFLSH